MRADVERHLDAVAGVEAGAADLGEFPQRPKIARAHFGVGLETAGGQHHALRLHLDSLAVVLDLYAFDTVIVGNQGNCARTVRDSYVVLACDLGPAFDQARSAAPGLHRQPAPEFEHAVDLVGLAPPDRHKAHPLVTHPKHGCLAARDQQFAQVWIGAVFGDTAHVVEEFFFSVGAEIGLRHFLVGKIRHQCAQVFDAVIDAAERAGGEAAITTGLVLGRALQHQDRDTAFGRGKGCTKRRIAGADDDNVHRGG